MKYKVDMANCNTSRILFKYGSAKSIIKILQNQTIKVTCANQFNDPFDTLMKVRFDFDLSELPAAFNQEIESLIFGEPEPVFINDDFTTRAIIQLRSIKDTIPRENLLPLINIITLPQIQALKQLMENEDEDWRQYLLTWRIFCLSEIKNNLLMWAHYADSHKGAVMGFKCVPELDSAFCAAFPVTYSNSKPSLGSLSDWIKQSTGQKALDIDDVYLDMVFTKSIDWAYEKEWRYPLPAQNLNESFDLRGIDKKEIAEVNIGCRMPTKHKKQILAIIKADYPDVKVYEAIQSDTQFALEFKEIIL
jgi:hypothetical protein